MLETQYVGDAKYCVSTRVSTVMINYLMVAHFLPRGLFAASKGVIERAQDSRIKPAIRMTRRILVFISKRIC